MTPPLTEQEIRAALADVGDPEIPAVSIVDLGMIERIEIRPDAIHVELLPTFVGCPALEIIRARVTERLSEFGRPVVVATTFRVPWTSDRITEAGRDKLRAAGFAPPAGDDAHVACPYCGSGNVALDNLFGPTQCRSVWHCEACRQPFEAFKPV